MKTETKQVEVGLPECLKAMVASLQRDLPQGLAEGLPRSAAELLPKGMDMVRGCPMFLSGLINDPVSGISQKVENMNVQELALGLGHYFEALAHGAAAPRGMAKLLPLIIRDAQDDAKKGKMKLRDRLALRALRLIWAAPTLGPRCQALAARACRFAWGNVKKAALHQRSLLLDLLQAMRLRAAASRV